MIKRLLNPRIKKPKKDKNKIIPYSPRNKKTKPELPNSILKPLISSLSPSAKSKGARLVSEIIRINQKIKKAQNPKPEKDRENDLQTIRKEKIKIARQISYLTVWAEERIPPIKANFEKELTPVKREV